jgi:membrane protein
VKFLAGWKSWIDTSDAMLAHWLRAAREALLGEMPTLAAGTALFAIISTVPLIAAVVSIYALVADPHRIQSHLQNLSTVLPPNMLEFLQDQLAQQTRRSTGSVGIALAFSVVVALWSSRGAASSLIDVLNRAYRVRERRGRLLRFGLTMGMAGGAMVGMILIFAVTVGLPGVIMLFHLNGHHLVTLLRWPVLMTVVFVALLALYRFAPSSRPLGTDRHLWPGALIATVVLILVSIGLSQYVEKIARFDVVYGAFGSVVVVLLWFYLSVLALVIGGFVNAELERHAGAPAPDRSMY